MVLGFSTILEFFGLGEISGIDVFFAAMAVIGTILFLIYFAASRDPGPARINDMKS